MAASLELVLAAHCLVPAGLLRQRSQLAGYWQGQLPGPLGHPGLATTSPHVCPDQRAWWGWGLWWAFPFGMDHEQKLAWKGAGASRSTES